MSGTWMRTFVHLVWGTWDRAPWIDAKREPVLLAEMHRQALRLRCEPIAMGSVADHVHALLRLHPRVPVAELARAMKSASTARVKGVLESGAVFRWQGGYAALTVSRTDVNAVAEYVVQQKARHAAGAVHSEWEPDLALVASEDGD